ncbi:MAG: DUF3783 domain-containing protein, partial [Ruminococcus sp.]|nr:DUF3783 domain-containing protein [Ruminococcus sp.]
MLIFSGYDGSSLNYTVTTLRQRGCIIPLKAILTDHN